MENHIAYIKSGLMRGGADLLLDETLQPSYMNYIIMLFILATILLIFAIIQKLRPSLSISYDYNHKPSYLKVKFISKLLGSATMYIGGLYLYFLTDLTKISMFPAYVLGFGIISHHIYRWILAKVLDKELHS